MACVSKRIWIETGIGLLLILWAAALVYARSSPPGAPEASPQPTAQAGGELSVLFSLSESQRPTGGSNGPLEPLIASVRRADSSVDAAFYDLDLPEIRDALLKAHRRGVQVRVVAEGGNADQPAFQSLILDGVPLVADARPSLMHHKFLVVDGAEVWTGSMNLTWNGAFRNDNNLVRIRSPLMAQNFSVEFDEMFIEQRFGPLSRSDTPYPFVEFTQGAQVSVYFAPDDGAARAVLRTLEAARSSIEVLAFSLTADPIAEELLAAHARGVQVRVVVEAARAERLGSEVGRLRAAGVDVRLDNNRGNMHHKVMVIDGQTVITGSYNFSRSAEERNDENLVIVRDRSTAEAFSAEFERIYRAALP